MPYPGTPQPVSGSRGGRRHGVGGRRLGEVHAANEGLEALVNGRGTAEKKPIYLRRSVTKGEAPPLGSAPLGGPARLADQRQLQIHT